MNTHSTSHRTRLSPLARACIFGLVGLAITQTASAACGRISIFDNAPRQKDLHAAFIVSIDGHIPGTTNQEVYRVDPGEHVLEVSEHIDNKYLTFNDRQRNVGKNYKTLKVDVAPNTTYSLAARLNDDKSANWQHEEYWDPVIWNRTTEVCH